MRETDRAKETEQDKEKNPIVTETPGPDDKKPDAWQKTALPERELSGLIFRHERRVALTCMQTSRRRKNVAERGILLYNTNQRKNAEEREIDPSFLFS